MKGSVAETAFCNFVTIGKLLNKAGHPDTYDPEALSLVRHAYRLCDRAGLTLADAITIRTDSRHYPTLNALPKRSFLKELADREMLLIRREAEVARLAVLLGEKTAEIGRLEAARSEDKANFMKLEASHISLASEMALRDARQASQITEHRSHTAAVMVRFRDAEAPRERTRPMDGIDCGNETAPSDANTCPVSAPPDGMRSASGVAWTDRVIAKLTPLARQFQ